MRTPRLRCFFTLPLGIVLFAICASARAEPAFNALDRGDPHYAEYQNNLCQGTLTQYNRLYAEKYWLDQLDPKLAAKSPTEREDWVIGYAMTASLRESARAQYLSHCGGGGRFGGGYDNPHNSGAAVINQYEREQARRKNPGNHNKPATDEDESI
jgi:hypothetical protein